MYSFIFGNNCKPAVFILSSLYRLALRTYSGHLYLDKLFYPADLTKNLHSSILLLQCKGCSLSLMSLWFMARVTGLINKWHRWGGFLLSAQPTLINKNTTKHILLLRLGQFYKSCSPEFTSSKWLYATLWWIYPTDKHLR